MSDFKKADNDPLEQCMDENLVGYLLNALDAEETQRVEEHLRTAPEDEDKLEWLRRSMQPLLLLDEFSEPPPNLAERTLSRVLPRANAALPKAPAAARILAFPTSLWRRADVLVAACLLILVGGIGVTWINQMNVLAARKNCENDLRTIHEALVLYDSTNGRLPSVHDVAQPPRDVAGMILLKLIAAGHLAKEFKLRCPGSKNAVPPLTFEEALNLPVNQFDKVAGNLTPAYGYTLGYKDPKGVIHGPKLMSASDSTLTVLMADSPPADPLSGNSPNHGGKGQNVLFLNGKVTFCADRDNSFNGDDLYLNKQSKVQAGLGWEDNVIGHSRARP